MSDARSAIVGVVGGVGVVGTVVAFGCGVGVEFVVPPPNDKDPPAEMRLGSLMFGFACMRAATVVPFARAIPESVSPYLIFTVAIY